MRSLETISPVCREMMDLYRDVMGAIDRGDDRDQCRQTLELGLRTIYGVANDRDPRLWKRCYICGDTGYEIVERHPALYGGNVAVRYARPCSCETGQARAHTLMTYDERQRANRATGQPKKTGWQKA